MPKETIFSDYGPFTIEEDGAEIQAKYLEPGERHRLYERAVVIAWNRNGFVEVGTTFLGSADEAPAGGGSFLSLDRSKINRMIQVLRRARDQAFGADA